MPAHRGHWAIALTSLTARSVSSARHDTHVFEVPTIFHTETKALFCLSRFPEKWFSLCLPSELNTVCLYIMHFESTLSTFWANYGAVKSLFEEAKHGWLVPYVWTYSLSYVDIFICQHHQNYFIQTRLNFFLCWCLHYLCFIRNWRHPETTTLLLCRALLSTWHYVPHSVQMSCWNMEWSQRTEGWAGVSAVPPELVLFGWVWSSIGSMQLWTLLSWRCVSVTKRIIFLKLWQLRY